MTKYIYVLDYNACSVDEVEYDDAKLEAEDDLEPILKGLGYKLSEISWMASDRKLDLFTVKN